MNIQQKFTLNNKVAIITGASKGIGKAIAEALGQAGAQVVISSRKQEAVDEVAKEFKEQGIDAVGIAAHMGSIEDIQTLVKKSVSHYGGIDIIVNNAASNPVFGPVQDVNEDAFDKIVDVNVKGPFELTKLAYPEMKKRGGGSIINISSVEGLTPSQGLGIYSVSKSALIMLTKVLAKEWGLDNIRANAICPGLIKTKFSEALWNNEPVLNYFMNDLPIKRVGESEDIAGLALFLSSEASAYCTGGVYTADGGFTI